MLLARKIDFNCFNETFQTRRSRSLGRPHCLYIAASTQYELRICTNKTCKSQGSQQIAQFGKDLGLPDLQVTTSGCLGVCGNGPNAVLIPSASSSSPTLLSHLSTPAQLVKVINTLCELDIDDAILKATELRLAGNSAAREGNSQKAIELYSSAIDLNPARGKHLLLSNRSGTKLASGDAQGALEDAEAAIACAPSDFTTGTVRQADALYALGRFDESLAALDEGAVRHPPFGKTQDYKTLRGHIEKAVKQKVRR